MDELRYALSGEVDLAVAPQLREDLRIIVRASDADLVVDCTHLTFIDSTGITVLLEAHRDLRQRGRELYVANVRTTARTAFEVLGLGDLLRHDQEMHESA
jgi:anti-sigma B factor antagonist